jgi:hypothetical protein
MSNIIFSLATWEDEAELRRILRQNPMPGAISVSFEREPDYFIGAKVEGPCHQTIVARDQASGEVIGIGSRAVRERYVNGSPQAVGYISQLRIDPRYRARRQALSQAFAFLRCLHQDGQAPFYFASIIEDNLPARRLLAAGLPGWPRFQAYARMHTLAINCPRKRRQAAIPADLRLARGCATYVGAIVDCLRRNGPRYQLVPHWTEETLFDPDHTPDLRPEDFFLALDGERVVGCLAAWDQSRFKQTVVRGYAGPLAHWRGLINLGARLAGWPVLPPPHTPFRYCYASHLAIDGDRVDIFAPLLRALYNHAANKSYSYFMLGLAEKHPFFKEVRRTYRHIDYKSILYLVTWEDELESFPQIDSRIPGPEIAIL